MSIATNNKPYPGETTKTTDGAAGWVCTGRGGYDHIPIVYTSQPCPLCASYDLIVAQEGEVARLSKIIDGLDEIAKAELSEQVCRMRELFRHRDEWRKWGHPEDGNGEGPPPEDYLDWEEKWETKWGK